MPIGGVDRGGAQEYAGAFGREGEQHRWMQLAQATQIGGLLGLERAIGLGQHEDRAHRLDIQFKRDVWTTTTNLQTTKAIYRPMVAGTLVTVLRSVAGTQRLYGYDELRCI